jgi:hypothetical protein
MPDPLWQGSFAVKVFGESLVYYVYGTCLVLLEPLLSSVGRTSYPSQGDATFPGYPNLVADTY